MSQNIRTDEFPDITKWIINGTELIFDISDADSSERFEEAVEVLRENENFPRVGKNSEIIRKYCQLFRTFFDNIFGEGTSEEIGIKDNARICNEIYENFLMFISKQKENNEGFATRIKALAPNNNVSKSKRKTHMTN